MENINTELISKSIEKDTSDRNTEPFRKGFSRILKTYPWMPEALSFEVNETNVITHLKTRQALNLFAYLKGTDELLLSELVKKKAMDFYNYELKKSPDFEFEDKIYEVKTYIHLNIEEKNSIVRQIFDKYKGFKKRIIPLFIPLEIENFKKLNDNVDNEILRDHFLRIDMFLDRNPEIRNRIKKNDFVFDDSYSSPNEFVEMFKDFLNPNQEIYEKFEDLTKKYGSLDKIQKEVAKNIRKTLPFTKKNLLKISKFSKKVRKLEPTVDSFFAHNHWANEFLYGSALASNDMAWGIGDQYLLEITDNDLVGCESDLMNKLSRWLISQRELSDEFKRLRELFLLKNQVVTYNPDCVKTTENVDSKGKKTLKKVFLDKYVEKKPEGFNTFRELEEESNTLIKTISNFIDSKINKNGSLILTGLNELMEKGHVSKAIKSRMFFDRKGLNKRDKELTREKTEQKVLPPVVVSGTEYPYEMILSAYKNLDKSKLSVEEAYSFNKETEEISKLLASIAKPLVDEVYTSKQFNFVKTLTQYYKAYIMAEATQKTDDSAEMIVTKCPNSTLMLMTSTPSPMTTGLVLLTQKVDLQIVELYDMYLQEKDEDFKEKLRGKNLSNLTEKSRSKIKYFLESEVNTEYKLNRILDYFGRGKIEKINENEGYAIIVTKMRRLNKQIVNAADSRIGAYFGTSVYFKSLGSDFYKNGPFTMTFGLYSRQIAGFYDIMNLFVKNATNVWSYGGSGEIEKKTKDFRPNSPALAFMWENLIKNFEEFCKECEKISDNIGTKFSIKDPVFGVKIKEFEALVSYAYFKNTGEKKDGVDVIRLMMEYFKKEMEHQDSLLKSKARPDNFKEYSKFDLEDFLNDTFKEDGTQDDNAAWLYGIFESSKQWSSEILKNSIKEILYRWKTPAVDTSTNRATQIASETDNIKIPLDDDIGRKIFYFERSFSDNLRNEIKSTYEFLYENIEILPEFMFKNRNITKQEAEELKENIIANKDWVLKNKTEASDKESRREKLLKEIGVTELQGVFKDNETFNKKYTVLTSMPTNVAMLHEIDLVNKLKLSLIKNQKETTESLLGVSSNLFELTMYQSLIYPQANIVIMVLKEQYGKDKRVFFIQTAYARNAHIMLDTPFRGLIIDSKWDMIMEKGNEKNIKIEKSCSRIKKSQFFKNLCFSLDATRFGDTYLIAAFEAILNSLRITGYFTDNEALLLSHFLKGISMRYIMMPSEAAKKYAEFLSSNRNNLNYKDIEWLTKFHNEFGSRLNSPHNLTWEGLMKGSTENIGFSKSCGFILGVLNMMGSYMTSQILSNVENTMAQFINGETCVGLGHSDDAFIRSNAGIPTKEQLLRTSTYEIPKALLRLRIKLTLTREYYVAVTDINNKKEFLEDIGESEESLKSYDGIKLERKENKMIIRIHNGVVGAILASILLIWYRIMGQRPSLAKTIMGDSFEVLQLQVKNSSVISPNLRFMQLQRSNTSLDPSSYSNEEQGLIYNLVTNGSNDVTVACAMLASAMLAEETWNLKALSKDERHVNNIPSLGGIYWVLPHHLLQYGMDANTGRLLAQGVSSRYFMTLQTMLITSSVWDHKSKQTRDFSTMGLQNATTTDFAGSVWKKLEISISHTKRNFNKIFLEKIEEAKPEIIGASEELLEKFGINVLGEKGKTTKDAVLTLRNYSLLIETSPKNDSFRRLNILLSDLTKFMKGGNNLNQGVAAMNRFGYLMRKVWNPWHPSIRKKHESLNHETYTILEIIQIMSNPSLTKYMLNDQNGKALQFLRQTKKLMILEMQTESIKFEINEKAVVTETFYKKRDLTFGFNITKENAKDILRCCFEIKRAEEKNRKLQVYELDYVITNNRLASDKWFAKNVNDVLSRLSSLNLNSTDILINAELLGTSLVTPLFQGIIQKANIENDIVDRFYNYFSTEKSLSITKTSNMTSETRVEEIKNPMITKIIMIILWWKHFMFDSRMQKVLSKTSMNKETFNNDKEIFYQDIKIVDGLSKEFYIENSIINYTQGYKIEASKIEYSYIISILLYNFEREIDSDIQFINSINGRKRGLVAQTKDARNPIIFIAEQLKNKELWFYTNITDKSRTLFFAKFAYYYMFPSSNIKKRWYERLIQTQEEKEEFSRIGSSSWFKESEEFDTSKSNSNKLLRLSFIEWDDESYKTFNINEKKFFINSRILQKNANSITTKEAFVKASCNGTSIIFRGESRSWFMQPWHIEAVNSNLRLISHKTNKVLYEDTLLTSVKAKRTQINLFSQDKIDNLKIDDSKTVSHLIHDIQFAFDYLNIINKLSKYTQLVSQDLSMLTLFESLTGVNYVLFCFLVKKLFNKILNEKENRIKDLLTIWNPNLSKIATLTNSIKMPKEVLFMIKKYLELNDIKDISLNPYSSITNASRQIFFDCFKFNLININFYTEVVNKISNVYYKPEYKGEFIVGKIKTNLEFNPEINTKPPIRIGVHILEMFNEFDIVTWLRNANSLQKNTSGISKNLLELFSNNTSLISSDLLRSIINEQ